MNLLSALGRNRKCRACGRRDAGSGCGGREQKRASSAVASSLTFRMRGTRINVATAWILGLVGAALGGILPLGDTLRDTFFDGLARCNQDFREVTKMFDRSCVEIEVHDFETGPFKDRDIRIKNRYIG